MTSSDPQDRSALPPTVRAAFTSNAELKRYELRGLLGRGAMGSVHRAWDTQLEREVALKVLIPQETSQGKTLHERFLRERRALGRLSHPHVVAVHNAGVAGGVPYLTMDLMPGGTLADRLEQGDLSHARVAEIVRDVALGLGHAHGKGIVHRDVKPGNVLLDQRGAGLIGDFGLARLTGAEDLTRTGQLIGTPHYLSPELATGKAKLVGPASDVFSLGVVLYEALSGGALPFEGDTLIEQVTKIASVEAEPLRSVNPQVAPALELIVARCLQKEPVRRYPSGNELAVALTHYLDQHRLSVALATPWRWVAAAGALLVLATAAAIASSSGPAPARSTPDPARDQPVASAPVANTTGIDADVRAGHLKKALRALEALPPEQRGAQRAVLIELHEALVQRAIDTPPGDDQVEWIELAGSTRAFGLVPRDTDLGRRTKLFLSLALRPKLLSERGSLNSLEAIARASLVPKFASVMRLLERYTHPQERPLRDRNPGAYARVLFCCAELGASFALPEYTELPKGYVPERPQTLGEEIVANRLLTLSSREALRELGWRRFARLIQRDDLPPEVRVTCATWLLIGRHGWTGVKLRDLIVRTSEQLPSSLVLSLRLSRMRLWAARELFEDFKLVEGDAELAAGARELEVAWRVWEAGRLPPSPYWRLSGGTLVLYEWSLALVKDADAPLRAVTQRHPEIAPPPTLLEHTRQFCTRVRLRRERALSKQE